MVVSPSKGRLRNLECLLSLDELGREGAEVQPLIHRVGLARQDLFFVDGHKTGQGAASVRCAYPGDILL